MERTLKIKKIIMILFFVFTAFVFVGCADVKYTRIYAKEGYIIDEVAVMLHKDSFTSGQAESIYGVIKQDVDNFSQGITNWIDSEFKEMYVSDISVADFMKKGYEVNVTNLTSNADGYNFSFTIVFGSIEHYVYFYGLNTPEVIKAYGLDDFGDVKSFGMSDWGPFMSDALSEEYEIDASKLFTKDIVYSADNVLDNFSVIVKQDNMTFIDYYCSRINSVTNSAYTEEELLQNINLTQVFTTDDARYFTNADSTTIDQFGYRVHTWDLNTNPNTAIEVRRARPNHVWWYILGGVIGCASVAFMFLKLKYKKPDSKKQESSEQKENANG